MVVEGACRGFVCGLFVCLFGVSSFFGSECAGRGCCVSFVSFFVRCVCFPRPSLQFPDIKAVHLSGAVRAQEGACMGVDMGAKVDSGKWKGKRICLGTSTTSSSQCRRRCCVCVSATT